VTGGVVGRPGTEKREKKEKKTGGDRTSGGKKKKPFGRGRRKLSLLKTRSRLHLPAKKGGERGSGRFDTILKVAARGGGRKRVHRGGCPGGSRRRGRENRSRPMTARQPPLGTREEREACFFLYFPRQKGGGGEGKNIPFLGETREGERKRRKGGSVLSSSLSLPKKGGRKQPLPALQQDVPGAVQRRERKGKKKGKKR